MSVANPSLGKSLFQRYKKITIFYLKIHKPLRKTLKDFRYWPEIFILICLTKNGINVGFRPLLVSTWTTGAKNLADIDFYQCDWQNVVFVTCRRTPSPTANKAPAAQVLRNRSAAVDCSDFTRKKHNDELIERNNANENW